MRHAIPTLLPVPSPEVGAKWHLAEPWVRSAVNEGALSTTAEDWKASCLARKAQLWLICAPEIVGCGITEIYETAKGLTCGVPILAAADFADLEALFDTVESWARAEGCVRLEGFGRQGWVRALKTVGWRPIATVIEKDLRHG